MKRERGFALLLVFVMAAAIAISLYRELPRVAFEAQRSKEQLLIDRGEQYKRAIQLYVRKTKTYPSSIEQLESTNQVRFLRKRYTDPMTGKADWRPVHINAGGVYIDSLVHKPPAAKEEEKSVNTFIYEAPVVGSTLPTTGEAAAGFPQARPSERLGMPMPGQTAQPVDPNNPQQQNAQPQPGSPQFPGIPTGVVVPPGAINPGGFNPAGAVQPGQQPLQPGQPFPTGLPAQPGQTPPMGLPAPGTPPQSFPQPGAPSTASPGQNQALQMINNMLTNPRPVAQGMGQPQGQQLGGGIAGFASTLERTGIKVYNEMEKYNEWEFLYDPTKDTSGLIGGQQQQQQQQQRPGQQPQQPGQPTQPFGQPQQPFGQPAQPRR